FSRSIHSAWKRAVAHAFRATASTLTPEMNPAWTNLALAQAYHGNFAPASASVARARALAPEEPSVRLTSAWIKLMSRNLNAAEAEIATWDTSDSRTLRMQALDVRVVIQRERGQYRAADATIQRRLP